jgi:hypothetical protein
MGLNVKKAQGWVLDLLFLVGAAVFAFGFWLAWHPLGFIVGGLTLAAFAFFGGYRIPRGESQ